MKVVPLCQVNGKHEILPQTFIENILNVSGHTAPLPTVRDPSDEGTSVDFGREYGILFLL